jgi:hypothetical protein
MGNVSVCCRGRSKVQTKYAPTEVHVPGQCENLWQALQRAHASRGKITMVRVEEGDYDMPAEQLLIDFSMIHIKGAGKEKTRFHRYDNIAKIQICNGARNVFIEGISINGNGSGDGIVVINKSSLRLEKCEIKDVGGFGLHVAGGSDCEAVGCTIWNNGCPGIWVDGDQSSCIVRDTTVNHNQAEGVAAINRARIEIQGSTQIHHNKFAGVYGEDGGVICVVSKDTECYENNQSDKSETKGQQKVELGGGKVLDVSCLFVVHIFIYIHVSICGHTSTHIRICMYVCVHTHDIFEASYDSYVSTYSRDSLCVFFLSLLLLLLTLLFASSLFCYLRLFFVIRTGDAVKIEKRYSYMNAIMLYESIFLDARW